jgi:hypothetical protein
VTTWKRPFRTAQERRRDRPALSRKVDTAALAPSMKLPPNRCECGHMRLVHAPVQLGDLLVPCAVPDCDCTDFTRESTDG